MPRQPPPPSTCPPPPPPLDLRAAAATYPGRPQHLRRARADARGLLDGCPAADEVNTRIWTTHLLTGIQPPAVQIGGYTCENPEHG